MTPGWLSLCWVGPPLPHLEGSVLADPSAWLAGLRILALGFQLPAASWPGARAVPSGGPQPKLNCPQMALGALVPLHLISGLRDDFPEVE